MIYRKSAFDKGEIKAQDNFKKAVETLIKSGEYVKFVNWHAAMGRYRMHGMGYEERVGMWRFLAWHRIYLIRFEKALRKHEPTAYIPYWKWVDGGVPKWMETFLPTIDGITRLDYSSSSPMDPNPKFSKPQTITVNRNLLKKAFTDQKTIDDILDKSDFASFSSALENGPHGEGHIILGGQMMTEISPVDPMFWLHHANVDRIWALWQAKSVIAINKIIDEIKLKNTSATKAEAAAFKAKWRMLMPFNEPIENAFNLPSNLGYKYA